MKLQRYAAIAASMAMTLSVFSGCGNSENVSSEAVSGEAATASGQEWEEVEDITWAFWAINSTPTEDALMQVENALNEITENKIGVHVNMEILDMGNYMEQMGMRITSGESYDLMTTFPAGAATFQTMQSSGQLLNISELLEDEAPELLETIPEEVLSATTRNGNIYGVPVYTNAVTSNYWMCKKEIFDALGFKADELKTLEDFHQALLAIKEAYPDMIPLSGTSLVYPGGTTYEITTGRRQEILDDTSNAMICYDENTSLDAMKVESFAESENFKAVVQALKQWNEEGLVDKDMTMKTDMWYFDPKAVSGFETLNYASMVTMEASAGCEFEYVKISDNYVTSEPLYRLTCVVPVTAKQPGAAVRFMNLLYTDAQVKNLVSFGIEGVHWEFKEDGRIGFPAGVDETNSGYYLGSERLFGNTFLNYTWDNSDLETVKAEKEAMDHAKYSPLMGFYFDTSNVSTEIASLSSVKGEFYNTLLSGGGDDKFYQEFVEKLNNSGLPKLLEEAQKQLDEWKSNN